MDNNPFYNDLVEEWQVSYNAMLDVKKSLTHRLNKQKSFVDADKKQVVEAENRLFEISNFLELTNDVVEAQKMIIEQFQIKERQAEIERRNNRILIGDMPHSPQYYHDSIADKIEELKELLTHQITK